MRYAIAAAAILGLAASVGAHADVYRWVDSEGRVHYSDRWVPGSELVKVNRSRQSPEAAAARAAAEQNRLAVTSDRIAAQQEDARTAQAVREDVAKAREEQCREAREQYQKAIRARRIFRTGKDGEREYLSEAEADEYRMQARNEMLAACGSAN